MHVRTVCVLATIVGVLAIPVAAANGSGAAVLSANGSAHWTIPLPNPFDVVVWNRTLSFNARKYEDGSVRVASSTTRSSRARRSSSTSTSRASTSTTETAPRSVASSKQ